MSRAAPTPRHRAPVPSGSRPSGPVFLNPSGRRWRVLRAVGQTLAVALVLFALIAVPTVLTPPASHGRHTSTGPTEEDLGATPLVVGSGPLVRVLRVLEVDGAHFGQEPYTGTVVTRFSGPDAARAAGVPYLVQRYGYADGVHRTISLTFDDGPDPVWTPRLLDLLSSYGVPATFFSTGEQMVAHPAVVRRIVREGHAIGNHSLTHAELGAATDFRRRAEIALTDRIQRSTTGTWSAYLRLPYEGDSVADIQHDTPEILFAQRAGYVLAGHDFDTLDWAHTPGPDGEEIPLPPLGEQDNITVLLHDGGGDRGSTLAYVERLILAGSAAGYTFHTMPQVSPAVAAATGPTIGTFWDGLAERGAHLAFAVPPSLLSGLFLLAVLTMVGFGSFTVLLALLRRRRRHRYVTATAPPASVLIAAFNEELVITRTLEHVLASLHPVVDVVVVDDGSTDATAAMVQAVADRDPRVRLVQQANAGKWAALNNGTRHLREPFVVTLDADTLVTPTTVGHLMAGFHSPGVGAVAGVIKVGNWSRNVVTRWQALEYVTQIGLDRSCAALLDAVITVPGACAAWRTEAVVAAGGYSDATLAEDCDLTLMLHAHGWRVEQADEAIAWTEAPETVDALLRQRVRWMYGTLQAVWRHRSMLLRPRFGWLGMVFLPMTVLTVLVPMVFTPFIALVVAQTLVQEGPLPLLAFFAAFAALYGVFALVAVRLMGERPAHLLMVPLYRLVYEPLRTYLLYACLGTALRGVALGWNKLTRTAHMDVVAAGTPAPETVLLPAPAALAPAALAPAAVPV